MSTIVYPNGCDTDVVAHVCDACATPEAGGVSSLAAIHKSYYATLIADLSDEALWAAGILAGKIMIIPETRGSMSSAAVTKPGYGRTPIRVTGRDFKLIAADPNWKGNHDTYTGLQGSRAYHVAWVTQTQVQVSKFPATWLPDEVIEEDIKSEREWKLEIQFIQKPFSEPADVPEGIFQCFSVT